MRRISVLFCAQIPWIICIILMLPGNASAWAQDEHPVLGDYVVATLRNDGYPEISDAMQAVDPDGISLQQWFVQGERDADRLDLSRNHYYDPLTGGGLAGFESSAQLADDLYSSAIDAWMNGDISRGMYLLGRAAHLVQDAAQPYHVHLDPFNGHLAYEDWAHNRTVDFSTTSGGIYNRSSAFAYVHETALVSYGYYDELVAGEANYEVVTKLLEPLAIRMSAGLVWAFFKDVEWQPPVLSAVKVGTSTVTLYWTPSAESNFLRYDVYCSDPGKDLVMDEAHRVASTDDRSANGANVTGLLSYGQYQFQVVTVLQNGSLESDVLKMKLGVTPYLIAGMMLAMGTLAVFVGIMYVRRDGQRRTK